MPKISFTRVENLCSFGTPDLLAYNEKGTFFTVELKVAKGNPVKLSPHQISFHVKHPHNTFILVLDTRHSMPKLYEGTSILQLVACGLKLDACCLSLEACYEKFRNLQLVACCLRLVACSLQPETGSAARYKGRTSVYRRQHF